MTDADGRDWPPDSHDFGNAVHRSIESFNAPPPTPPTITGRNGTTYQFGQQESRLIRRDVLPPDTYHATMNNDGTISVNLKNVSREAMSIMYGVTPEGLVDSTRPAFPTTYEWAMVKDSTSMENEEVLRRRIERARKDIDAYTEKLEWLESLPDEPATPDDGDGPVVYFRKCFGDPEVLDGAGWQYAAVKVRDGGWAITGGKSIGAPIVTWRELLAFVYMKETEETSPKIWIVSGWDELT